MNITADARDRLTSADEQRPSVEVALGGAHLRLKAPVGSVARVGGGMRGEIKEFSRSARKRLMIYFNQLNLAEIDHKPLFITLTYPSVFPADINESKAHLEAFTKRLIRRYPRAAVVWKLEYQKRGAPHYHLLVFNVPFIPFAFVSSAWYDCVASGQPEHLAAGTRVERIRSWRGVLYYASKYLGKTGYQPAACRPGRFWGIINRKFLPRRVLVLALGWRTWYSLRRALWRYARRQQILTGAKSMFIGCSLFLPATVAMSLISSLAED